MLVVLPSAWRHPGGTTGPHLWGLRIVGYRGGPTCQVFRGRSHRRGQNPEIWPRGIAWWRQDFERSSISAIPSSKSPRPIAMSNEDTKRGMSSSLWDMNNVSRQPPVKRGDRILRRASKESEDGNRIVGCPPPW